jgi:hypothetical protein
MRYIRIFKYIAYIKQRRKFYFAGSPLTFLLSVSFCLTQKKSPGKNPGALYKTALLCVSLVPYVAAAESASVSASVAAASSAESASASAAESAA